jgi:hypothetical protein
VAKSNVDRFNDGTAAFNQIAAAPGEASGEAVSAYLRLLHPEIHFEPQQAALQGTYVGTDGVREWLADLGETYGGGHIHFVEIRDLGDRVLGLGTLHLTGKGSGIQAELPVAVVAVFQDGLMTQFKDYGDSRQALEAVGLKK